MKSTRLGALVWMRMMRFIQHSNQLSNDYLQQYDLTIAKFDILNQIYIAQPLTQTELSEKMMITQGGISRMLTRLEADGLIVREVAWKIKTITLTPEGLQIIKDIQPKQEKFQAAFFEEVLTNEELKEFSRLLNKVYHASLSKKP